MKHRNILRKVPWLLALCVVSALAFLGCKSKSDQPAKSDQPQSEQPQKEHPEHPR